MAGARAFAAFWPIYLRRHTRASSRVLVYAAITLALLFAAVALVLGGWWWLATIAAAACAMARGGTWWTPVASVRMFALWLAGRLGTHLAKASVRAR